jgi:hypothetical protein
MNNCEICNGHNPERHHIKTRGSGGTDDDWNIIMLCRKHHIIWHQYGISKMVETYPLVQVLLRNKGWVLYKEFDILRLRRP